MNRHDEQEIDVRQMRFDGREWRRRIQGQAGVTAARANRRQRFRDIVFRFRFDMNGDRVRARFDEARHVVIGTLDHEMHVERQTRQCSRTVFTRAGPNEMLSTNCPSMMSRCSQSAPASMTLARSGGEMGEIRGQNGRSDKDFEAS